MCNKRSSCSVLMNFHGPDQSSQYDLGTANACVSGTDPCVVVVLALVVLVAGACVSLFAPFYHPALALSQLPNMNNTWGLGPV